MAPPAVSIVVPSWNGRALLATLLPALRRQRFRDFETIVVDNGSRDDSEEWLRVQGDVRVLRLERNLGFAGAMNRGIAAARAGLLLLLNNDMEPEPGFVGALVAAAARHPEAGSFACKVLARESPGRIDSAGDALAASGRSTGIGRGAPDGPVFAAARRVFAGTGGAVLYRREVLLEAGGFDERFFLYVEDTDLALRAQLLGHPCLYVPDAVTVHLGAGSMRGREDRRARYCLRNHLWLLAKAYPAGLLPRHGGEVLAGIGRELRFAFGATRARVGALRAAALVGGTLLEALVGLPGMIAKRLRLRRRVPDRAIEELFE